MPTVAESLVKTLAAAGVKRIYGIVGDSLNGITDEIRRQKPSSLCTFGMRRWRRLRLARTRTLPASLLFVREVAGPGIFI